jgi:hypothetical protein
MLYNMHDGENISLSTNTTIFLLLENDILKTNKASVSLKAESSMRSYLPASNQLRCKHTSKKLPSASN